MKSLTYKFSVLIASIIIVAIGGAFLFVYNQYFPAAFCILVLMYIGYKLYRLNIKTTEHFKLFTDSIKFTEGNLSFSSDISDEVYLHYYNSLKMALEMINIRSQRQAANISFYDTLLNRIDFALFVTDKSGKVMWINKRALDLLGRPKPANLTIIKRISDEVKEVFESLEPKCPKTLKLETNGRVRSLVVNLSEIRVKGDSLNIYTLKDVQFVVDETEGNAWQQLIRVLTHEMMNSLTPIISLSESLSKNEKDPELLTKAMEIIHRRSEGLVSFINNYKKLTQIPFPQRTDIRVEFLFDDIANLMKDTRVKIHLKVLPDNLTIYADKEQMEQVLINLIKNAIESCADTITPIIRITATSNCMQGQAVITISDNGLGMDSDVLEKIFIPFYTTKLTGSGIGLSLCRQIVAMHGGTLSVISKSGVGSTFTIRI